MIVRMHGIKKVRSKGRLYFYHRKTGERIIAAPNTIAFAVEIERLDQMARPSPEQEKKRGTIGALIAAYRASPEYVRLADRTRADYGKVFDYLASIDGMPLIQLNGAAVIKIRDRALAQRKRRFANHVLQVLSTILNWGKPRDLAPGNPAAGIREVPRPRDLAKANRAWSDAERDAVLDAAAGGLKMAIALGMFAGMRIGDSRCASHGRFLTAPILNGGKVKPGDAVWLPGAS